MEIISGTHGIFLWCLGSTAEVDSNGRNGMWHARMVVVGVFSRFSVAAVSRPDLLYASPPRSPSYPMIHGATVEFCYIFNQSYHVIERSYPFAVQVLNNENRPHIYFKYVRSTE